MSLSVIIPSKTISNLLPCIEAVLKHEPEARIIVIDDGLSARALKGIQYVDGVKPFAFPRAINMGCRVTTNDVIVLNDDALLRTTGGFSTLQQAAIDHPEYGLIASTTNVTGNPNMQPRGIGFRDEPKRALAFICVFIPRRTIEKIGPMDEQFGGLTPDGKVIYGFCDQDYTRRVRIAGLKIAIHDGCFVDHASLRSTFRGDPRQGGDITESRKLYLAKWGDLN